MTKAILTAVLAASLLLALPCTTAFAAGAALVQATDYPGKSGEAMLTAAEAKFLNDKRTKDAVSAEVVKLNPGIFASGVVTVYVGGKTREFVGAAGQQPNVAEPIRGAKPGEPKFKYQTLTTWVGRSKEGATLILVKEQDGRIGGEMLVEGRPYWISNPGGVHSKFHILWEPRRSEIPMHSPPRAASSPSK
jgi:hypothetical protein